MDGDLEDKFHQNFEDDLTDEDKRSYTYLTGSIVSKSILDHPCSSSSDSDNGRSSCCQYDYVTEQCGFLLHNHTYQNPCGGCRPIFPSSAYDEGGCSQCKEYHPSDSMGTPSSSLSFTASLERHACAYNKDISECCVYDSNTGTCGVFYHGEFLYPCASCPIDNGASLSTIKIISIALAVVIAAFCVALHIWQRRRKEKNELDPFDNTTCGEQIVGEASFPVPVPVPSAPVISTTLIAEPIHNDSPSTVLLAQVVPDDGAAMNVGDTPKGQRTADSTKTEQGLVKQATKPRLRFSSETIDLYPNHDDTDFKIIISNPIKKVKNTGEDERLHVFLKVKVTKPQKYIVSSNKVVLAPGKCVQITIRMKNNHDQVPSFVNGKNSVDKILFESYVVDETNEHIKRYLTKETEHTDLKSLSRMLDDFDKLIQSNNIKPVKKKMPIILWNQDSIAQQHNDLKLPRERLQNLEDVKSMISNEEYCQKKKEIIDSI